MRSGDDIAQQVSDMTERTIENNLPVTMDTTLLVLLIEINLDIRELLQQKSKPKLEITNGVYKIGEIILTDKEIDRINSLEEKE
jgi:hypothetical protein